MNTTALKGVLTSVFCLIIASLSGCAGSTAKEGDLVAAKANDDRVCIREKVTGSNMKRRICYTKAEMQIQKENAQKVMERSRRGKGAISN